MKILFLINLTLLMISSGCDRVQYLTIENQTTEHTVDVLFASDMLGRDSSADTIFRNGRKLLKLQLAPGERAQIGTVNGKYIQGPDDLNLEYLEVHYLQDTLIVNGKYAVYTLYQKEGSRNWTYIIKDHPDIL